MSSRYWQHRFDGARRAALAMADAEPRRAAPVIGAAGPIGGH
jgi:hypothetical protein